MRRLIVTSCGDCTFAAAQPFGVDGYRCMLSQQLRDVREALSYEQFSGQRPPPTTCPLRVDSDILVTLHSKFDSPKRPAKDPFTERMKARRSDG